VPVHGAFACGNGAACLGSLAVSTYWHEESIFLDGRRDGRADAPLVTSHTVRDQLFAKRAEGPVVAHQRSVLAARKGPS
jgi:hypothetical protein